MAGNTFGLCFTVTTFGESHGPAIGAIVDGCPPGLALSEADIQKELRRRQSGLSRYTSQRHEADSIKILSGVFEGITTGTPIGLLIENTDAKPQDYDEIKNCFRPGHADYTYDKKYGQRDYRGGGRASARETAMRVAAGAIAKKYLFEKYGIGIRGCLMAMGDLKLECKQWDAVEQNPFFCADPDKVPQLENRLMEVRKKGDSLGALIRVEATGVLTGLGEPLFDKLDADIAHAMMSIPAVKGVEIGDGFDVVEQMGSEHRDELTPSGFSSNHAGGILGGISTGQTIIVSLAVKPPSSILIPGNTLTTDGKPTSIITKGRHDPCVGMRAVPVAEAMLALVLMDHVIRHRGQMGNRSLDEAKRNQGL